MIIQGLVPQSGVPAGLLKNLKSGDAVSIKVLGSSSDGYDVFVKGLRIRVSSTIPLEKGSVLQARVYIRGSTVIFQTLQPGARFTEFLREAGLPDDRLSRIILKAFKQEGLPLKPDIILRARRQLKSTAKQDSFSAGLLAALFDKGLDSPPRIIDYLYGLGRHGGKREGKDGRSGKEKEESTEEDVQAIFREGREEDPVQLFNHKEGSRDHWIIIPFGTEDDCGGIHGSVHVRLEKGTGRPADMRLFCESSKRSWRFSISDMSGGGGIMQVYSDNPPESRETVRELQELKQKLHNLGVKVDDIIRVDSFCSDMTDDADSATEGIDTYV